MIILCSYQLLSSSHRSSSAIAIRTSKVESTAAKSAISLSLRLPKSFSLEFLFCTAAREVSTGMLARRLMRWILKKTALRNYLPLYVSFCVLRRIPQWRTHDVDPAIVAKEQRQREYYYYRGNKINIHDINSKYEYITTYVNIILHMLKSHGIYPRKLSEKRNSTTEERQHLRFQNRAIRTWDFGNHVQFVGARPGEKAC